MSLHPVLTTLFRGKFSASDIKALDTALEEMGQAIKDRLHGFDADIEALQKENAQLKERLAALEALPRTSLQQRLRSRL